MWRAGLQLNQEVWLKAMIDVHHVQDCTFVEYCGVPPYPRQEVSSCMQLQTLQPDCCRQITWQA